MPFQPRAGRLGDFEGLEIGVSGAAESESNQAGSNGCVAVPVDQYETAGNPILVVWIEADRLNCGDINEGDFVAMQFFRRQMLQCVDIDAILQFGHHRANRLSARFKQITSTGKKWGFRQPNKMRSESIGALPQPLR